MRRGVIALGPAASSSCRNHLLLSVAVLPTRVDSVQARDLHINLHGGRSSVSGIIATVFGCTGFFGRYVVNRLGKIGSQVVVAYRGEESSFRHLKVMGDLGQIVPAWYDVRDEDTVRRAVKYSNVVINLVGKRWETKNFTFDDVHVKAAATIAKAAKEAGVERFIHVSTIGADENSTSPFARSKAKGEQVVREIFPEATILRPAIMIGMKDHFLTKFGMMARFWPFFMRTLKHVKFQPIAASDMATALMHALARPEAAGKTYEIGGPRVLTMEEATEYVCKQTFLNPRIIDVPFPAVRFLTGCTQWYLRKPRYTVEELDFWAADQMTIRPDAQYTIKDLGLTPEDLTPLELSANYLRQFRRPATMGLIYDDQYPATSPSGRPASITSSTY
jgi:NADH dehydrogenase (ubiquinone) 1 alpha subcomplex subunit 9